MTKLIIGFYPKYNYNETILYKTMITFIGIYDTPFPVTSHGRQDFSVHQYLDCLFNVLSRLTANKRKGICEGNLPFSDKRPS